MELLKTKQLYFWILLIVISRFITHIVYIEDIDSLRFALSTVEYDLLKFQPHFPAYPVYCFITKLVYWLTRSVSFSHYTSGVIGMVFVFIGTRNIYRQLTNQKNTLLLDVFMLCSPLIWLMSNRFMPDVMGLALLLLASNFGLSYYNTKSKQHLYLYVIFVGLLAGVRVSYLPFLFPMSCYFLFNHHKTVIYQLLLYVVSVLIWLVPIIVITGYSDIIDLLLSHSDGHFNEWGGTIRTDDNVWKRLYMMLVYIWSDGLGGWLPNRSLLFLPFGGLVLVGLFKSKGYWSKIPLLVYVCLGVYFLWALLYQNVLYKPRHLMPFIPILVMAISYGLSRFSWRWVFVLVLFLNVPNMIVAYQHKHKTALAQAVAFLEKKNSPVVVNDLVGFYITRSTKKIKIEHKPKGKCYVIGATLEDGRLPSDTIKFYHNPYVNRMWSEINVYCYD